VGILSVGVVAATQNAWASIPSQPKSGVAGTDGTVYASARIGDVVYVGGIFDNAVDPTTGITVPRENLMAVDVTTGAVLPWDVPVTCEPNDAQVSCANVDGPKHGEVRALIAYGNDLIIGGYFTAVGGTKRLMWAIVDTTDGSLVDLGSGRTNGRVGAFALDGSILYAGGSFTKFDGESADKKLSAVDVATSPPTAVPGFDPNVSDVVRAIVVLPDHNVVIGGQFQKVNGTDEPNIAELTPGDVLVPWADNPIYNLWDLAYSNGVVYAGRGEGKGGKVIAYNPAGGTQYWQLGGNGDVQALTIYDDDGAGPDAAQLIAGGHWSTWNGLHGYRKLVAINLSANPATKGTLDTSWQPQPNSTKGVWHLDGTDGALFVGGEFDTVGGISAPHFAIFS